MGQWGSAGNTAHNWFKPSFNPLGRSHTRWGPPRASCVVRCPKGPGGAPDLPLEEWLLKYAFPLEARCSDVAFARQVWGRRAPFPSAFFLPCPAFLCRVVLCLRTRGCIVPALVLVNE